MRKKWEYKTIQNFENDLVEYVEFHYNELGQQGWELVTTCITDNALEEDNKFFTAFFKREIND